MLNAIHGARCTFSVVICFFAVRDAQCFQDRKGTQGDLAECRRELEELASKASVSRTADAQLLDKISEQQFVIEELSSEVHMLEEGVKRRDAELSLLRSELGERDGKHEAEMSFVIQECKRRVESERAAAEARLSGKIESVRSGPWSRFKWF